MERTRKKIKWQLKAGRTQVARARTILPTGSYPERKSWQFVLGLDVGVVGLDTLEANSLYFQNMVSGSDFASDYSEIAKGIGSSMFPCHSAVHSWRRTR
jgi:hypothetical protein